MKCSTRFQKAFATRLLNVGNRLQYSKMSQKETGMLSIFSPPVFISDLGEAGQFFLVTKNQDSPGLARARQFLLVTLGRPSQFLLVTMRPVPRDPPVFISDLGRVPI